MKRKLIFVLVLIIFSICNIKLQAGEINFGWNLVNEAGGIYTMHFMPDNDYFILSTAIDLQIRKTETGELVKTYPYGAKRFEFTPDSTRLVLMQDSIIQLIKLSDMSLIKEYKIPNGTDTAGLNVFQSSEATFTEMKIDPIRPYIYVIRLRAGTLSGGKWFHINKILIYNYETMEEVKELYVYSTLDEICEYLAVSKDGKYLAAFGMGSTYLRVWDLQNMSLKNEFQLFDPSIVEEYGCEPKDIKFSEINTGNIFISGSFPRSDGYYGISADSSLNGIIIYNINDNKIADNTFAIKPKQVYSYGKFAIFNNEERIMNSNSIYVSIINLILGKIEATYNKTIEFPFLI